MIHIKILRIPPAVPFILQSPIYSILISFPNIINSIPAIIEIIFDLTINYNKHMGNEQCNECQQLKNQNTAYGQFQVCHYDGKQLALIEKKIQLQPGLYDKINGELTRRLLIGNKNIVRLHKYDIMQNQYQMRVMMYYEYMPKTLKEYLIDLAFKQEEMNEKQLFNIVYCVQSGLQALYQLNIQHGCVNLQTILFKNNLFKITDVSSTTYLTSYQMILQGNKQQFPSQKMLNNLNYKIIKPNDFSITDDLFSLGLIILMIIAKGRPQNFYKWHQSEKAFIGTFNLKYIQHCMRLMNRNFSSKFCNKIKSFVLIGKQEKEDEIQGVSLTAELQDLEEDMSRIMNKIKFGLGEKRGSKQSTMRNSQYCTPHQQNK